MTEYCDVLNVKLLLEYSRDLKWRARIEEWDFQESGTPVFGIGDTPYEAIENYESLISGKYLIID